VVDAELRQIDELEAIAFRQPPGVGRFRGMLRRVGLDRCVRGVQLVGRTVDDRHRFPVHQTPYDPWTADDRLNSGM
jgi:hypothetical protein